MTLLRRLRWLALALVPAALLMGVTAHLSVDIASVPLLWAIPLGLYLLSFIMVFARWPILKWLWLLRIFQATALAGRGGHGLPGGLQTHGVVGIGGLHLAAFFLTALVCHGAMAADRPASRHLTEFYLWMSAGGVAGGLLCALVAPVVFNTVLEYPLMLVAACLLAPPRQAGQYEQIWRACLVADAGARGIVDGRHGAPFRRYGVGAWLLVIPLGLYLLSFTLVFVRGPILGGSGCCGSFRLRHSPARRPRSIRARVAAPEHGGKRRASIGGLFSHRAGLSRGHARDRPATRRALAYYL